MTIMYSKEILFKLADTSELRFVDFFNLIDGIVQSDTIRYGPKYRVANQLYLYSRENGSITLLRIHTTSDNDYVNVGKSLTEILSKESNYDFSVGITQLTNVTNLNENEKTPMIQLYGQDHTTEDSSQERTKRKHYKVNFGEPQVSITGLEWQHEIQLPG